MTATLQQPPRKTAIIQARYMDQMELELFLLGLFGPGKCDVTWTRGFYQCVLPRGLKRPELERLAAKIGMERYKIVR
ncbi:hypothetical protein RB594_007173 [Gaeumannomyces avenae]